MRAHKKHIRNFMQFGSTDENSLLKIIRRFENKKKQKNRKELLISEY